MPHINALITIWYPARSVRVRLRQLPRVNVRQRSTGYVGDLFDPMKCNLPYELFVEWAYVHRSSSAWAALYSLDDQSSKHHDMLSCRWSRAVVQ